MLFLNGGPSHLDMWDLKPDAAKEIRSPFSSIPTTVPGDIIATLYHLLGVDPQMNIYDVLDHPHPLVPTGRVLGELFG